MRDPNRLRFTRVRIGYFPAMALLLATAVVVLFFFNSVSVRCERSSGTAGECIIEKATVLGESDIQRLPLARVRGATLSAKFSRGGGASPAHTDTSLFLQTGDDDGITLPDLGFLGSSLEPASVEAFNAFLADPARKSARIDFGGPYSAIATALSLFLVFGGLATAFGFAKLELAVSGSTLTITGDDFDSGVSLTHHSMVGITDVLAEPRGPCLRIVNASGKSEPTPNFPVNPKRLAACAARAKAFLLERGGGGGGRGRGSEGGGGGVSRA